MSKPFDATTKAIDPAAWLRVAGILSANAPAPSVRLVESDISTVSGASDRLLVIEDGLPEPIHIDRRAIDYRPRNRRRSG